MRHRAGSFSVRVAMEQRYPNAHAIAAAVAGAVLPPPSTALIPMAGPLVPLAVPTPTPQPLVPLDPASNTASAAAGSAAAGAAPSSSAPTTTVTAMEEPRVKRRRSVDVPCCDPSCTGSGKCKGGSTKNALGQQYRYLCDVCGVTWHQLRPSDGDQSLVVPKVSRLQRPSSTATRRQRTRADVPCPQEGCDGIGKCQGGGTRNALGQHYRYACRKCDHKWSQLRPEEASTSQPVVAIAGPASATPAAPPVAPPAALPAPPPDAPPAVLPEAPADMPPVAPAEAAPAEAPPAALPEEAPAPPEAEGAEAPPEGAEAPPEAPPEATEAPEAPPEAPEAPPEAAEAAEVPEAPPEAPAAPPAEPAEAVAEGLRFEV